MIKVELIESTGNDEELINDEFNKSVMFTTNLKKDENLIKYMSLGVDNARLKFLIKAPIYIAEELSKYQTGLVRNDIIKDYNAEAEYKPEIYKPDVWKEYREEPLQTTRSYNTIMESCKILYQLLREEGIPAEKAKMVLPQNTMTEWYWSGTLFGFTRFCNMRNRKTTKCEVTDKIKNTLKERFPKTTQYVLD